MLHPLNDLSVELFLDSDVRHAGSLCGSVPALFTGRKPDNIAGTDFLDWAAFALHPATARSNDEGLSKRMCMPCGPSTGFERYASALNKRGIRRLEEPIDAYVPSEPFGRALCGWLRASSFLFPCLCSYCLCSLLQTLLVPSFAPAEGRTICAPDLFASTGDSDGRSRVLIARRSFIARYPSAT
jgi:hypothetical protein